MHHYRNDETDVFYSNATPTLSKSERPHLIIDNVNGRIWVSLGGVPAGSADTFYPVGSTSSGATETLTAARVLTSADNGKRFFLDLAGGFTVTLPANATTGFSARFIVKTAPTTAYIILAATADTIIGYPLNCGGADSVADGNAAGDQLNFAANVALPSDQAEFISDGTSWHVRANAKAINAITITG